MSLTENDAIMNGKYRVERLLGKGAFAQVYLARHLELDLDRAVKVLTRDAPGVGSTLFDDYQARFRLEAQLGARLDHPQVVKVFDFEVEEDTLYLVMEYAAGGSLADLLEEEGALPLDDFLRIAADAAAGLGAIHEQLGIVHRDVKPSNILLTEEGRARISDLGLAQVEGGISRRSVLGSEAAPHPGTPLYMSPEQEREYGYLQYPSDVYSLGCVMFEMLTGKRRKNQRPGTRVRDLRSDAPEWLDELIAQCTLRDKFERPWDGNEVLGGLSDAKPESTILEPEDSETKRESPILKPQQREKLPDQQAPALRQTDSGLVIATAENVAQLLTMPQPPERVWWEKAGMELCLVPAGEFVMGSPEGEGHPSEHPQHTVYLDPYYMGRYPVTNAQYARFVRETGHRVPHGEREGDQPYNWNGESQTPPPEKEEHPVVMVSWEDAVAYCEWAGLRLPTEAEWEKAARGADGRKYPWGDEEPTARLCNSGENVGTTTPVGQYSPQGDSPYGCADMAGNVWEWAADWDQEDYYHGSPSQNPTGPSSGTYRVLRGGSWVNYPFYTRGAYRDGDDPGYAGVNGGLRCARGSQ